MKITGDDWLSGFDLPALPDGLEERVFQAAAKAVDEPLEPSWIERLLDNRLTWASTAGVVVGLLVANLLVFTSGAKTEETASTLTLETTGENQYADVQAAWQHFGIPPSVVNQWLQTRRGFSSPRLADIILDTPADRVNGPSK